MSAINAKIYDVAEEWRLMGGSGFEIAAGRREGAIDLQYFLGSE